MSSNAPPLHDCAWFANVLANPGKKGFSVEPVSEHGHRRWCLVGRPFEPTFWPHFEPSGDEAIGIAREMRAPVHYCPNCGRNLDALIADDVVAFDRLAAEYRRKPIIAFLQEPVPCTGTAEWRSWQARCRALDPEAPALFLEALEHGTEEQQYTALLGLRLLGWYAYGLGYYEELQYEVGAPGAAPEARRLIRPKIRPTPP